MEKSKRISIDEAKEIVEELGFNNYTHPSTGRNNWVFLTNKFCISIPKDGSKIQYSTRAVAMKHLMKNQIPTTCLVKYSQLRGVEYIVTKRVEGGPIDLEKLEMKDVERVHKQSAHMIKSLHETKVTCYGRLDEVLCGSHSSWSGFVDEFFVQSLKRLSKDGELWNRFGLRLQRVYDQKRDFLKNHSTSFLHGDFHLDNMIFQGTKCKAIIDLDIVMQGDSHWDLGHYVRTFHGNKLFGKATFFSAYGSVDEDRANFYAMIIWARKIASQAENRRGALHETVPEMEDILKWFIS